jgi:hypothetical protein
MDPATGGVPAPGAVLFGVGGNTGVVTAAPAVQVAAYAAGQVIGGLQTIPGFGRLTGGSGIVQMASVFLKVGNTQPIDLVLFNTNPAASTFADKAALAVVAADFDKLIGVAHVTDWTNLGTPSLGMATALGMPFQLPTGSDAVYVVPVARGAITFASTSDFKFALKALRD